MFKDYDQIIFEFFIQHVFPITFYPKLKSLLFGKTIALEFSQVMSFNINQFPRQTSFHSLVLFI